MLLPVGQIDSLSKTRTGHTHDTHCALNISSVAVKTCVWQPTGLTRLDSSHLEQVSG